MRVKCISQPGSYGTLIETMMPDGKTKETHPKVYQQTYDSSPRQPLYGAEVGKSYLVFAIAMNHLNQFFYMIFGDRDYVSNNSERLQLMYPINFVITDHTIPDDWCIESYQGEWSLVIAPKSCCPLPKFMDKLNEDKDPKAIQLIEQVIIKYGGLPI
jgi:hypothetical protein